MKRPFIGEGGDTDWGDTPIRWWDVSTEGEKRRELIPLLKFSMTVDPGL